MNMESVPQVWDDDRDGQFFGITAALFSAHFCFGASVLLGLNDGEQECTAVTATASTQPITRPPVASVK